MLWMEQMGGVLLHHDAKKLTAASDRLLEWFSGRFSLHGNFRIFVRRKGQIDGRLRKNYRLLLEYANLRRVGVLSSRQRTTLDGGIKDFAIR